MLRAPPGSCEQRTSSACLSCRPEQKVRWDLCHPAWPPFYRLITPFGHLITPYHPHTLSSTPYITPFIVLSHPHTRQDCCSSAHTATAHVPPITHCHSVYAPLHTLPQRMCPPAHTLPDCYSTCAPLHTPL